MGLITRRSWAKGWVPDCDPTNGPLDALLRMDNGVLDDLGAVVLRAGSTPIGSPLADADVHSLYTAVLNGTRTRLVGAGNSIYANGTAIASGTAGAGDVAFGAMAGQVFWARGATTKKYDGTTVRNWGIAMTGGVPTLAALTPDFKTIATCDSGESPAIVANEGTIAFAAGQDGAANGSIEVTPATGTGRGTITKTFASETDFTAYTSGQVGCDDDLVEAYIYVTEPSSLRQLTIMVDVNGGSTNAFQDDYFVFKYAAGDTLDLSATSLTENDYTAEGRHRRDIEGRRDREGDNNLVTDWREDQPSANAGWNKIAVRRGMFRRVGGTTGKGWNTVKAVRLICHMTGGGASAAVRIDNLVLRGGAQRPLTGRYRYRFQYVRNASGYLALSPASDMSAEILLKTEAAAVTVPADGSRDSQVNEIWIFRMGGQLDAWYRVAVKTGVSGGGSYAVNDLLSDRDALILGIRLETDNAVPPANILGIAGPYFDRLWCLTATTLWPSRRLDPDAYSVGQGITVGDTTETPYWVAKTLDGLYVGTSKDVYRIEGTAAELPDDTIDVVKRPLGVDHPPISAGVAQDGNHLFYLADDGWRALAGAGSVRVPNQPVALYRGESRHGVSAVNTTTGRFVATVAKGQLVAVTPEGSSTTSSPVLYRGVIGAGVWYRHVYPQGFRSIHREPDGTLIAGDAAGTVWALDSGTTDGGTAIPITLWTVQDDNGAPFTRKDPRDCRWLLDTGGSTIQAALHLDGAANAAKAVSATSTGTGTLITDVSACPAFIRAQWRLTGSPSAFRCCAVELGYLDLPHPFQGRTAESTAGYPGPKVITGLTVRLCTLGVARTLTLYVDGVAQTPFTVTTATDEPLTHVQDFAATVTGTDISLSFDGDVELYDWAPIILYKLPLPVLVWDSGPLDLGVQDLVWIRSVRLKVIAGADLTITPYFDGVAWPTLTAPVSGTDVSVPTIVEALAGRGYMGRTPRIVVTSTAPFSPYWVELLRRSTAAQTDKKPIRFTAGVGGTTKA